MLFSQISKKQAFLTHLSASLVIFFILAYLIVFQWYPSYYMQIDGGDRGLATIFFVDVILGPGLTLLVFKQGKKGLKFDMTMIILFQIIALSWGIKSVYLSRPALTVFYDGKFACMAQDDVSHDILGRLSKGVGGKPVLALLRRPDTYRAYQKFTKDAWHAKSGEIYFYTDLFEPMDDSALDRIKTYRLNVAEMIENNKMVFSEEQKALNKKTWSRYEKENPAKENISYIPISCRYKQGMAVFDSEIGEIIDYVDVYTKRAVSDIQLTFTQEEIDELKAAHSESKKPVK